MTTITIGGLPSKAPLQDSYYIPVESASITGRVQASDIATYIASKTLTTVSAASGSITNTLQAGSIITGDITATSLTTSADIVIGGNLIIAGAETVSGTGTFGSDLNTSKNLNVSGNIAGGNISAGGSIGAGGNISSGGNYAGAGNVTIGNATISGNATIGNVYATIRVPVQNFITSMSNVSFVSIATTANASVGSNLIVTGQTTVSGNIVPVSNVAAINLGSTTAWYNNIYGTAIHALYADLAEKYTSDANYGPGTVLVFGDETEVTVSTKANDVRVAGVVSTDPAYLMNGGIDGVAVALTGRVPCKVIGTVKRGDLMVTSDSPGIAMTNNNPQIGTVIGKALGTHSGDGIGVIEVVVGRI